MFVFSGLDNWSGGLKWLRLRLSTRLVVQTSASIWNSFETSSRTSFHKVDLDSWISYGVVKVPVRLH